jgi:hypothetical protein
VQRTMMAAMGELFPADEAEGAWETGRALSFERAIEEALEPNPEQDR